MIYIDAIYFFLVKISNTIIRISEKYRSSQIYLFVQGIKSRKFPILVILIHT